MGSLIMEKSTIFCLNLISRKIRLKWSLIYKELFCKLIWKVSLPIFKKKKKKEIHEDNKKFLKFWFSSFKAVSIQVDGMPRFPYGLLTQNCL